jgi:predicted nucleic acid-binding protein
VDAFDADVLIFAASFVHPMGPRVLTALTSAPPSTAIGSVLLLPEVLSKPTRAEAAEELAALGDILGLLDLLPVDQGTAGLAVALAAKYRLKVADAVHLATAVGAGADRFLTNNSRDFPRTITEIDVTYPADLPDGQA